jgi:peptidoglycan hydrolase CwlO-like protein
MVLASIGATSLSSASPSKQDVADAKQRLDSLNGELSVVVEQFNLARIRLVQTEQQLEETREEATRARARADDALAELNDRAGRVYQGFQSQWSTLLEASSIADFSDRIEFMGQLARADADLAATASNERREALWLADELEKTDEERRSILQDIERKQAEIRSLIDQAQKTYEELDRKYRDALAAEREAAAAAAEAQARSDITTGIAPGPVRVVTGSVDAVIAAAQSVIGVPYVFGAADPAVGFDCSGLTMWAWAHAGSRFHTRRPCSTPHSPQLIARLCSPATSSSRATVASARASSITSLSTSGRVRPSRPAVPARLSGTGPSIGTRSSGPPDRDSERRLVNATALG